MRVPPELIEKLDRPAPRYTSYPTVPAWQGPAGSDDYAGALQTAARRDDALSLYVHLPFCPRKCDYCGCNTSTASGRATIDAYLDRLGEEIGLVTNLIGTGRPAVQIHWGGGTPNFLTDGQCERVMDMCRGGFTVADDAEISIEIDPRVASAQQIEMVRGLGFNRASLGVQDFAPQVQQAIGRRQSRQRTLEIYAACRDAGLDSVNLDLVYGLPAQTTTGFGETLRDVLDLGPDRIACFGYAHVPWVRPNQKAIDEALLPAPPDKFALFVQAVETAEAAGYQWIGLDHFARADDELAIAHRERRLHRNFMGYTTRPAPTMLAFGASGIGEVAGHFFQNDPAVETWSTSVGARRLPVVKGHRLSRDDQLRRLVILNLMCNLELPFDLTVDTCGAPVDQLLPEETDRVRALAGDGLVECRPDGFEVTPLGHYFIRNICLEFDGYLDHAGDRPLFSRTV